MSFWNTPRMPQQSYGWGNAVADIVGAIVQRNQNNAQAEAYLKADEDFAKTPIDNRLNTAGLGQGLANAGQQFNLPQQGLGTAGQQYDALPDKLGMNPTGLFGNPAQIQKMPFTPSQNANPALAIQPMQSAYQKTLDSMKPQQPAYTSQAKEFRTTQEYARAMQPQLRAAVKRFTDAGMSAQDAYKLANQRLQEVAGIRVKETQDKYASKADDELMQAFGSNDPRKILQAAAKHKSMANRYGFQGADMQLISQAMKLGAKEFITQRENGEDVTYARTPDGQFTEVHRSKPGLTEKEQKGFELQERGLDQDMYKFNNVSANTRYTVDNRPVGGHGSGNNQEGKYVDVPGLGKMTPNQVLVAYRQAKGGTVTTDDGMGGVKTRTVPPNPDLVRLLEPLVKQTRQDLNLPQMVQNTGNQAIDSKIQAMRDAGADEQMINDMVWEEQNKPQQEPRYREPIYTGSDYLGF